MALVHDTNDNDTNDNNNSSSGEPRVPVVVKIVDERSGKEELRGELSAYARLGWTPRPSCGTPRACKPGACGHDRTRGAYGLLEGLPNHMVLERMDTSLFRVLDGGEERVERWMPTAAGTVSVLLDLTEGLQKLHAADVVHCDLRPANVLLLLPAHRRCPHPKKIMPTVAKVADLGLAERQGNELDPDYVSRRRGMVHLSGDATATAALDMVGLGTMIVELIAARNLQSSSDLRTALHALDGDVSSCMGACTGGAGGAGDASRRKLRCMRKAFCSTDGNFAASLELLQLAKECIRADPLARPSAEEAHSRLLLAASLTTDADCATAAGGHHGEAAAA
jgi:serine/threonine protein kinase